MSGPGIVVNRVLDVFVNLNFFICIPFLSREVEEVGSGVVDDPDRDGADERYLEPGNEENLQPEVSIFINYSASTHRDQGGAKVLESLRRDRLIQNILGGA